MKVILLGDVARLGRRFEIKEVPDGHAVNFLIPRKLVQAATPENLKRIEERKKKAVETEVHDTEVLKDTLSKLEASPFKIAVEANEQGHLFKGLKASDIAAAIKKEVGPIDESNLTLKTPIKATGDHEMHATVGKEKHTFTLTVVKK